MRQCRTSGCYRGLYPVKSRVGGNCCSGGDRCLKQGTTMLLPGVAIKGSKGRPALHYSEQGVQS